MSKEYLREAYQYAATNSTDQRSQIGAVLVDSFGKVVAWGANRFPKGVRETPERLERPAKYAYVVHAEAASILDAARRGVKTEGLVLYGTWVACNECAKSIIEAGIVKVVGHKKTMDACPESWIEPIRIAVQMFQEAGVEYVLWSGEIGGIEILFNGQTFRP